MKKTVLLTTITSLLLLLASASLASEDASKLIAEGNRLWSENKVEDAEVSFKKAIEADPDSPEAYGRLGALLMVQNRGDDAIAAYQEAITRDSENAKYFAALQYCLPAQGISCDGKGDGRTRNRT